MGFEVKIKPAAWLDLLNAMIWYDTKRENLGKEFFDDFTKTKDRILENPKAFFEVIKRVRIQTERFPYKVFYIISGDIIFIIGVYHSGRSNSFIRKHLKDNK